MLLQQAGGVQYESAVGGLEPHKLLQRGIGPGLKKTASFVTKSVIAFAAILPLSGCGSDGNGNVAAPDTHPTGLVSVSGKVISRDGKPWIPHAFQQVAFVAPPDYINTGAAMPIFVTAAKDYTPTEYQEMVAEKADSVRIQFAQTGIDPSGLYASQAFTSSVIKAVQAARSYGLTVILSDQDEQQTGETNEQGLPDPHAQAAWMNLLTTAPWIGNDTGIMLEMYNEPFVGKTPAGPPPKAEWDQWQTAMNALIATIRGTGAKNVLIADGLEHAEELSGAPALTDLISPVVYASHPYAHNYQDQNAAGTDASGNVVAGAGWDVMFGNFAATNPVIVTEWGNGYYCNAITGRADVAFLQYLQAQGVGLVATTWDWAGPNFGSVRVNFPTHTITSFPTAGTPLCHIDPQTGAAVIDNGVGPGQLVQTWFTTGTPSTMLE